MRDHLQTTGLLQANTPAAIDTTSRTSIGTEDDTSYSATFREMFCVTAQDIARTMETSLVHLGCLYEDVFYTGTLTTTKTLFKDNNGKTILAADVTSAGKDIEAGLANPVLFGRGQLLVLTRKVGSEEAGRLQNVGYRFATIDQIGDQLARSFQIPRDDLHRLVSRLQSYCERETLVPRTGTYLASFLLQPSPVIKGLDIIVPKQTPDRLPMVQLSRDALSARELKLLSGFNGATLDECLARISQCKGSVTMDDIFLEKFRNRIQELLQEVPEPALRSAVFSAQQLDIAHGTTAQKEAFTGTVFAFCGIKEVYSQSLSSPKLHCIPLSFFRTNLRTYPGSPDHAILAHKNHKEFSLLLSPSPEGNASTTRQGTKWSSLFRFHTNSVSETTLNPDSSSEKGLVGLSSVNGDGMNLSSHPFGGIMVSQDVVISQDQKDGTQMEMRDLGVRSEAGVADTEQLTMADRLMSITTSFRDPHTRAMARENPDRR